jgi:outer membrane protein insertion porin family
MFEHRFRGIWGVIACCWLVLSSCNTTKYLDFEEVFLEENRIEFTEDVKIKKKGNLKYELSTLYKQRANTNFLFVPREHFYYKLQDTVGRSNFVKGLKRWQMRQFGEEPAIYDEELAERTREAMVYYLQHKGYFEAEVVYFRDFKRRNEKKYIVTYEVRPKTIYTIDTVRFISRDSAIQELLYDASANSLLKPGGPVEVKTYDQEVRRITRYLRNNGYAYFGTNFISNLEGDSSGQQVDLQLEVLLPARDSIHRTYRIGDLFIYPQYDPANPTFDQIDSIQPGVFFLSTAGNYGVRAKAILESLYLTKGSLYRQEDYEKTNRQLSSLGIFRFVTIKDEIDPDDPGQLNFRIYLTPNKRFEFGSDLEVNTSNSPFAGRRLLGVSGDVSLRHRNIFKGAELFVNNLEGGVDLNFNQLNNVDSLINSIDIRATGEIYFPKFVDFAGFWRNMNRIRFVSDNFYEDISEKASTRVGLSYNYLRNIDFYQINSFNASYGYDFRPNNRFRYQINHIGVDYYSPQVTQLFEDLFLSTNEFLRRSFDKQLFTSFFFRNFTMTYTGVPNRFGESFSIITGLELSGIEVYGANVLFNALRTGRQPTEVFDLVLNNDTIQFSQHMRMEVDLRHYRDFDSKKSLALRVYTGIAFPFGFSNSVPYVRQFFAGGPQSVRAWRAREIGPGGYLDPITLLPDVNATFFYQTGDFKIDLNAEFRFFIFNLFGIDYEGAIFIDAGNVWTLSDTTRELSQLAWNPRYNENNEKIADNFLKYMAVGTGFGLRLDFAYFIFRADIGYKLRNPYPTLTIDPETGETTEVFWRDLGQFGWRDLNLNIGLGYPF